MSGSKNNIEQQKKPREGFFYNWEKILFEVFRFWNIKIFKTIPVNCLFVRYIECTCGFLDCNNQKLISKMKLSELKKLKQNPRTISTEDMEKLKQSIKKFGVIEWRPFLISTRTGENIIIGGNQRYEACKALWIKQVPVHIMEGLTEEEEKEIIIRDNVSNWNWNFNILANEWEVESLANWWVTVPNFDEIDFENVKSNADREITNKEKKVTCPNCDSEFMV